MVSKHLSSLAFNIVNWYVRVKRVDLSWGGSVCYCAVGVMLPTFSVAPFTHLCHCFAEMGVDNIELDDSVYKNMSRPTIVCQQFLVVFSLVLNLSIPDVPFPVLLSTFIRSRFQAKPATLLIPIDFPFLFAGRSTLHPLFILRHLRHAAKKLKPRNSPRLHVAHWFFASVWHCP